MWEKSKNQFRYRLSNKQVRFFGNFKKKERGTKVRNTFVPRSLKTHKRWERQSLDRYVLIQYQTRVCIQSIVCKMFLL